ncbi:O-antigen ligase family protein [Candidatus Peregrinibacteria bacterium]|nr:O-antigen ligase family protein [Candidatus Peregrinibacteria bacterium]
MQIVKLNKYLLLFNLFFLQAYLIRFKIGSYPTNLQEILIAMQVIIYFLSVHKSKKLKEFWQDIKKYRILNSFILLTLISILLVPIFDYITFVRHLKFLFFGGIFVFIFLETFHKEKYIGALKIAGYGAVFFGLFSSIYNLLGFNVTHDERLLGPMDSAVYLAYFLAPFFILFAIEYLKNRKKSDIIFAIILLLLIFATRSMGALLGSFLIMAIYFWKKYKFSAKQNKKILIGISSVGIILFSVIFFTKILPTFTTNYSSLDERGEIWLTSLHLLKDPGNLFFGLGYGQFQYHYLQNAQEILGQPPLDLYVLQPHNIFLLFIFQYGILGLLLIFLIIYKTIKRLDYLNNTEVFMLLYFLIHGIIDTPIFKNDLLLLFILLAEIGLTLHHNPETKSIKTA